MHSCEVLVVGGGPAGSSCARRLVQAGLDVALVDRARFPRDKVCAGWITPAVVRTLEIDLAEYARTRTLQPFTGFKTASLSGRLRLTDFARPVSYGIRRCEFDTYLLDRAGARRLEPRHIRDLRWDHDEWIVDGEIRARMVVGAGGHFCPVAAALNQTLAQVPPVIAQEAEFELDPGHAAVCPIVDTVPELYFWPDLSGYAWCVRKGQFLNIGAGRLAPALLPPAVREFTTMLERRGGILPGASLKWKGHAYLLNRTSTRRLHAAGALLVGDAAGLALAPSGEGILAAVESGLLAAEVIVGANHDYRAERMASYVEGIKSRFGTRSAETWAVPKWLTETATRAVLAIPWLTKRVLLESGFLHLRRPDLPASAAALVP